MTPEQTALATNISQQIPTSGRACAGTGKTTTAVAALQQTKAKTLACAFNKSAQLELASRLQNNKNIEAKTLNGLGHRLTAKALGHRSLKVDPQKLRNLSDSLFPLMKFEQKLQVQKLTREARIAGLVPANFPFLKGLQADTEENWQSLLDENLEEETIAASKQLLTASIQAAQQKAEIDFDDQIYLSALSGNLVTDYELVVVDEAQDLNPLQHRMLQKFYRTSVCIIGDPRQSIYGFRGAVSNSMQELETKFSLQQLPLTVNFRCAPQIITFAQQFCPEIQAGLTIQGTVDQLETYELEALPSEAAILCRCNAPLLRMCFQLINVGRWPRFLGRDIGKSLISTLNLITKKKTLHQPTLAREIHKYFEDQIATAFERKQDHKVESLEDRRDCLFAVLEQTNSQNSAELIDNLKSFAEREGAGITLSSIHRAKGLEWPTVFWLDNFLGTKFELKALEKGDLENAQQERNLSYVAATRAKNNLFFISTQRGDF